MCRDSWLVATTHMLALQFEKAGFNVELSDGGKQAFTLVQNLRIDVVLTDIEMPNGHGIELFRLIREWQLDLPHFLMTAGRNVKSLDPLVGDACGIFYKPFDSQTVIDTVRNFWLVKAEM